ncbi:MULTISPECIES: YhgE/Pip domain-containing protein [Tsukamurella]|uniref:YhgE/Pip domain-containing protein n=2 Tax=Tsukamurella TaxID=2060 RepID=A0A5C5RXC6_9ACTN|nr:MULTISPECIES: YhgE/Pip domain-containing protein [Tsukamurella]NMD56737.1 YhgE/Pip domain-containing protein [Tsukamurella columbiensis]TWS27422.1 YhgE/Pip domain-containing protein [Tsukamurella conjunctivitidis]
MAAGLAFGSEIKRFGRSRLTRAAIVVLMLLPLVYGALYLWAFWDPFGNVNKMPVALVNADKGTEVKGQKINAGAEVEKSLADDKSLDWNIVSPAEAQQGVQDGTYYFMLELPENFSSAIASPMTGKPEKAQLRAVYNDANNYISSTIGQTAMSQVLNAVSTRISGQAVNQVLSMMITAGSGIEQAADGAGKLHDGLVTANDGAQQLATGLGTAKTGSTQLRAGSQKLSDGITQATDPLLAVTKALSGLGGNTAQIQQSAAALADAADKAGVFIKTQDAALAGIDAAIAQLTTSPDPAARQAAEGLRAVRAQLAQASVPAAAKQQVVAASSAAATLTEQLRTPGSPLQTLLTQVGATGGDLTAKLTELRSGAQQLAAGNATLDDGITKLSDGATKLSTGTGQLRDGSQELSTKLREGAGAVPKWSQEQTSQVAQTIGGPVQLDAQHENRAPNFGTGMAPFFLTLALFFGALVLWMVFRPLQNRAIAAEVLAIRVVMASYLPAAAIGLCQAVILYCVVRFGLGLEVAHPVAMIFFMMGVSLAFIAFTQAVNAFVGPAVGRVLIMALLMLQLVSSGGMYPVETTARPFQILHKYDPMTYGVNGLRQLILGGIDHRLWVALGVLLFIWLASVTVSCLSARRNRLWNLDRLIPAIKI